MDRCRDDFGYSQEFLKKFHSLCSVTYHRKWRKEKTHWTVDGTESPGLQQNRVLRTAM